MSQSPTPAPSSVSAILASLALTPGSAPSPTSDAASPPVSPFASASQTARPGALHVVRREPSAECVGLAADMHPVLQRVYAARGIRAPSDLDVSLERLHPVGTLEGVQSAVDLLLAHRVSGRVLVIGDFDADGATSTALMIRALTAWGFESVDFLVPNRFEFGYGLTPEIVTLAATRSPTLIVTVDNGISSVAGVSEARARGIAVLITDHHLPGARTPDADVIVNPNLPGSRFASPALAELESRSTSWLP